VKSADKKLIDIARQELPALMADTIVQSTSGWDVYKKYSIVKNNNDFAVYEHGSKIGDFSNTRTALSWCIASKRNQINTANQILNLERHKQRLLSHVICLKQLAKQSKTTDMHDLLNIKINAEDLRIDSLEIELNKYVSLAKYWQIQGFNNETARTIISKTNTSTR